MRLLLGNFSESFIRGLYVAFIIIVFDAQLRLFGRKLRCRTGFLLDRYTQETKMSVNSHLPSVGVMPK